MSLLMQKYINTNINKDILIEILFASRVLRYEGTQILSLS